MSKKVTIIIVGVIFVILVVVGAAKGSHLQTDSSKAPNKITQETKKKLNYTVLYALNHYSDIDSLAKNIGPSNSTSNSLKDNLYVLKGNPKEHHAGGWYTKAGRGVMFEVGKREAIKYVITTDNKDVATWGQIKQAFKDKNNK